MSMFSASIRINGVAALAEQLGLRGTAVEQAKNSAVDDIAKSLQQTAQMYAVAGHTEHPDMQTGAMQADIQWSHEGEGKAQVYTTLDYSFWVEFGHSQEPGRFVPALGKRLVQSFVPAYPFFRPALTQVFDSGEAESIIISTLTDAVENGNSGGGSSTNATNSTAFISDVSEVINL